MRLYALTELHDPEAGDWAREVMYDRTEPGSAINTRRIRQFVQRMDGFSSPALRG